MEIRINSCHFCLFLLLPFFSFNTHLCFAADTLYPGESLYGDLISKQGNFELGFFKPGSSTSSNRYIAIWYHKISIPTTVWIANRDNPVTDYSSDLKLLEDGNLVILDKSKNTIWSTNLTSTVTDSCELVLGDDGNLVLRDGLNPSVVFWQSFDHPGDTWLPGGKLRYDKRTKSATRLTSWKDSENPAQGMYSLQFDPDSKQYALLQNGSNTYWTSGSWDGERFSNIPETRLNYIYNYSYISNENESYFIYTVYNKSIFSRLVMSLSGQVTQHTLLDNSQSWNLFWSQPRKQCDVYAFCGAFNTCNEEGSSICKCLPGFQPSDSSGGCTRKTPLQCGSKDGFLTLPNVKFSNKATSNIELLENYTTLTTLNDKECELACLVNCSCNAYSHHNGCAIWNRQLLNIQQLSDGDADGQETNLYLKLATSEFQNLADKKKGNAKVIIITTGLVAPLTFGIMMYVLWRWIAKQRGNEKKDMRHILLGKINYSHLSKFGDNPEFQIFDFSKLVIATNNFDSTNKLGQGGFGPVYKGRLSNGREIAVKRLCSNSGQGLEEFKNEVAVISKLQHRNLVRLVGCCIQGDEKMLIYEYMANKSLDAFIFDSKKQAHLDWSKRFEIIMGICRGIIYLHRDSRLRVIHRDLKAGNILLDHEMKPKISDFGMARIFGAGELQANTLRVVGTYGYMSPEYAMEGLFSEKSDVYSFGVLLLEILSGKRNTSFYHHEQSLSLVGHAWKLWSEGNAQELIDPMILESSLQKEILRCIHVGLLCVQDCEKDRPTMTFIVSMLKSEIPNLAIPKQPAFIGRHVTSDSQLCFQDYKECSNNNVTFTTMEGR